MDARPLPTRQSKVFRLRLVAREPVHFTQDPLEETGMINKKTLGFLGVIAATTALAAPAYADVHARAMNATCFSCHGMNGKSSSVVPGIAGMNKDYFVMQMKNFASGARPATVMGQHAAGYTDAEIEQMADFFSRQK
jgi:cytochrome subunit of sulfide dehydrogenase